jgi:hypothetical protein
MLKVLRWRLFRTGYHTQVPEMNGILNEKNLEVEEEVFILEIQIHT